jgi:hypothetical protein
LLPSPSRSTPAVTSNVIHRRDGRIRDRDTFGNEQFPAPAHDWSDVDSSPLIGCLDFDSAQRRADDCHCSQANKRAAVVSVHDRLSTHRCRE